MMLGVQNVSWLKASHLIKCIVIFCIICITGCAQNLYQDLCIPCEAPQAKPLKNIRVALVLGNGGFRGSAYLGVIEVFEKEGIPIDLIVGTSAGSMIGALYCDKPNIALLKEGIFKTKKSDFFESTPGPIKGTAIIRFVNKHVKAKNFEELKIPLVAVASNLNTNKIALLRTGPIAPAILASCADPLIFSPVLLYGQTYVDGAVLDPIPVDAARALKPKMVIAVNVATRSPTTPVKSKKEFLTRCLDISYYRFSACQAKEADITINPCFYDFDAYDDKYHREAYEHGKRTAEAAVSRIKQKMKEKGIEVSRRTR